MGGFGPAKPGFLRPLEQRYTPLVVDRPRRGSCLASRRKKPVKCVKDYSPWYNSAGVGGFVNGCNNDATSKELRTKI